MNCPSMEAGEVLREIDPEPYQGLTQEGFQKRLETYGYEMNVKNSQSLQFLLQAGLLCNDAGLEQKEGKWFIKGDPTEGALIIAAVKGGFNQLELRLENPRTDEIPFSSERKRMATIHQRSDGRRVAFMKGAPEVVLEKCSCMLDDGGLRELSQIERKGILEISEEMAKGALRVWGLLIGMVLINL